ncbi:ATP synthase F1 subunit delta [Leptobacterium sp. I13]|uniref:ATP synthase F1 subunit delta n=1 Tax=Leptobacterium meishanense TaxID=3128904 RepID=UPI0030EC1806
MAGSRAAIRYAKAVLSLARDKAVAEVIHKDMELISKTVANSDDLQMLLQNPVINPEEKKEALKRVFSQIHEISTGLIDLLAANKRIELLAEVAKKYNSLYDEWKGEELAVVTTAVPLSGDLEKKVLENIKKFTKNKVTIQNEVDESIIGGFILRLGDLQYNASVADKLDNLKRTFNNSSYSS